MYRRTLSYIIFLGFILTLCSSYSIQDSFQVRLSLIYLPSPKRTIYELSEYNLKLYKEYYFPNKDSVKHVDKHAYKKLKTSTLTNYLNSQHWDTIPSELITPTIDGFNYHIDIQLSGQSYTFSIDNTYHPAFDSLFVLCNQLIPNRKVRENYSIYYEK